MKKLMKKLIKKLFPSVSIIRDKQAMRKWNRELRNHYLNNNISTEPTREKAGYIIMLDGHAIEKGMTSLKPREFGVSKATEIIKQLQNYDNNGWVKDFAYDFGISILKSYVDFYKEQGWDKSVIYQTVNDFLSGKSVKFKTGAITIKKDDYIKAAKIDFDKFLSSRHSIRRFEKKKISSADMKKAAEMAAKTPTACNRQMIKMYFVKNDVVKNKIIKYSKGMTNFDNDSANMVVITYDTTSFRLHEMHQGMFNAGLFAMNLVNALHSLGIGSCMLEYFAKTEEENEEKRILGIPDRERIAIVLAAGYYPKETVVPHSVRKPISEIYREV